MPFAPFPRPPHRTNLLASQRRQEPSRPDGPYPSQQTREQVQLAPTPDRDATREWAAHLAAGRIAVAPPAPDPAAGEYRLASLAAILGRG